HGSHILTPTARSVACRAAGCNQAKSQQHSFRVQHQHQTCGHDPQCAGRSTAGLATPAGLRSASVKAAEISNATAMKINEAPEPLVAPLSQPTKYEPTNEPSAPQQLINAIAPPATLRGSISAIQAKNGP